MQAALKQQRIVAITTKVRYRVHVTSDLELFQTIVLAITQAKRMDVLLPMIVSGLVDRVNFALVRIWLIHSGIPVAGGQNEERFLRLSASAGSSQLDGSLWNSLEGEFARIAIGTLKIGHIAERSEPLHLERSLPGGSGRICISA